MSVPWLSALGRRVAFRVARFARAQRVGGGPRGRLLSADRRSRGVVVIWALERSLDTPEVQHALAQMAQVDTRVLVTTALDIRAAGQTGCMVEAIPDAGLRSRVPRKDWAVYLDRRIARIRESWDPDLEVCAGMSVEDFLDRVGMPDRVGDLAVPDPDVEGAESLARTGYSVST